MIYLDNAATTLKKPLSVKLAVIKNTLLGVANPGRGGHYLSLHFGKKILETRETVKQFFNASEEAEVIFTANCTEALNLIILGTLKKGGHIITTANEHNSVLRPLHYAKNNFGISYSIAKPNELGVITVNEIKRHITPNTYLVAVNHASNVTGAISNITEIGELCKKQNILFSVDSAQSAGHEKIDIIKSNIHLLAFAGHKGLYGLQGTGGLIINNTSVSPLKFGGTGSSSLNLQQPEDLPDKLESGTLNTPGILALQEGIRFVEKRFAKINNKTNKFTEYILCELTKMPKIKVFSKPLHNSGVISFEVIGADSNFIAQELSDRYKICVRSGIHCAPLIHKHLGTETRGLVRVSVGYFNKSCEIKKFVKALKQIIAELN